MIEALIGVASFFGGGFLTAIGFIISRSDSLAVLKSDTGIMKTDIATLKTDVKEIKERPAVMCSLHLEVAEKLAKLEAKGEK
jgi:hypothetical protein